MGREKENNLITKSLEYSKEIVHLYRRLTKRGIEKEILNQLLRSATSVGANITEAQGGFSDNDYLSKVHIAYKELLESTYWLELLFGTGDISKSDFEGLQIKSDEIAKILYTIIKNVRNKTNNYLKVQSQKPISKL
jgi:four helix bundle protein